jgi:phage major head subunit gpT-like protein
MATSLSLEAALAASNTAFQVGYEEYFAGGKLPPGQHQFYTDEQPMDTETKRLDWLSNIPVMERWLGARRVKSLRAYSQIITANSFVATEEFTRKQLQYGDVLGLISRQIGAFVKTQAAAFDKDACTTYLSASGAGPTGYDGVAVFSTAHPYGPSGNQSNLADSLALSPAALDTVLTAMSGLKLENGEPAGVNGDTLIVGPALKFRAMALVGAMSDLRPLAINASGAEAVASVVAATASSNVFQGSLKLIVDPRRPATGTGAFWWEVIDSSLPKPLVRHLLRAPEPHHQDQMDSYCRFEFDKLRYGMEGDWKTDAGFWPSAYRATGTA